MINISDKLKDEINSLINTTHTPKQLPPDGYILKILEAKLVNGNGANDRIDIFFDIAEGEYTGFFRQQYDANTYENKRWKGKYSLWLPYEANTEMAIRCRKNFSENMKTIRDSNEGFIWNWDETSLIGLKVGGVFRTVHTVIEGNEVSYTALSYLTDIRNIDSGNFKVPADLFKGGTSPSGFSPISDDDLPF